MTRLHASRRWPGVRTGRGVLAGLALGALLLAGCGSSDDDDRGSGDGGSGDGDASDDGGTSADQANADAFPITIEHKYGSTTIEEQPERVATFGLTDQDALLALGVAPVATTEWFGEQPGAIWPWAKDELDALGAEEPEVVGDSTELNFEGFAANEPDLILALYSGITQEEYNRLSEIAPTVAPPAGYVDYGIPWDELTRTAGAAIGKADEADALVKEVEAQFAAVSEENPEFAESTAVMATPYEGIFVYGPEDPRGRFLTALGFQLPEGLAEVTGDEFGGQLSEENVDLIDVDAIMWLDVDQVAGSVGGPLYERLAVHTEGREVFLNSSEGPLGAATSFVSVLSLPFLLDGVVPHLNAALDGDPATTAD